MSYKSIIVNLAVDASPVPIVKFGIELAERFGARLIVWRLRLLIEINSSAVCMAMTLKRQE